MGITIVQKSDLSKSKSKSKIALVLAGGAVSGGAFKLGGLQALDRFMLNRRITDFDIYVGTSAGAILSVYLANGIPVAEIINSLEGKKGLLDPMLASDLYFLNYKDFIVKPLKMILDLSTCIPKTVIKFFLTNNIFRKSFRSYLMELIRNPNINSMNQFIDYCLLRSEPHKKTPSIPWGYIPTGIFVTDKFENSIRKNLENNQLSNNFIELYQQKGKILYIVATNLDTSERVVFGPDANNTIPISKAIQASIAIPFFYKPVRIDNVDYVDGAVAKTTSMDLAIEKGAELVVCYNPFRPFNLNTFYNHCPNDSNRIRISEDGVYAVFSQVMRTILHTRLMNGLELRRKNPDFKGDIILIEPTEYDDKFFDMNPLAFWERRKAAKRGYESVKESISRSYPLLKKILNAYGIDTSPSFAKPPSQLSCEYLNSLYENMVL